MGNLYEGLLEKNANEKKSGAGQYFTPRVLIDVMTRLVKPQPGERCNDPACGTFGFMISASQYVRENTDDFFELDADTARFEREEAFSGCELVHDTHRLALMNAMLHDIEGEISLDYITDEKHYPLGTTDEYFKSPEPDEEYIVHLCGDTVILSNGLLVQALSRLPAQKQEMLYLSFFKRMPQHEIGRRYGRSRSAVGYHIRKAIQQLYEEMEGLAHEE